MTSQNSIPECPPGLIPVIVWVRISQDPDSTLASVRRLIREDLAYVASNPAYWLVPVPGSPVIKDEKGRPTDERFPAGVLGVNDEVANSYLRERDERLADLVRTRRVHTIVTRYFDRIWRPDPEEMAAAYRVLKSASPPCKIDQRHGPMIDIETPGGELLMTIMGGVARHEVRTISVRERGKFAELAETDALGQGGTAHGARPFGYQHAHFEPGGGVHLAERTEAGYCPKCQGRKQGTWRTYLIHEAEAALTRDAYRRADAGESLYSIICDWDDQGIATAQGNSWRKAGVGSLRAVLLSERNIGMRRHSPGWHEKLGPGKGRRNERPEGKLHPANWPAILDGRTVAGVTYGKDLYDAVVAMLRDPGRNKSGGVNQAQHLLAGLTYCGLCGARMKTHPVYARIPNPVYACPHCGETGGLCGCPAVEGNSQPKTIVRQPAVPRGARYVCTTMETGGCGKVLRRTSDVEAETTRVIVRWLAHSGLFDQAMTAAETEDMRALRKRQRDLENVQEQLDGDYYAPASSMSKARYDKQCARIGADLADVARAMSEAVTGSVMDAIPERGQAFAHKWDRWGREGRPGFLKRREVLSVLIEKVTVHPSGRTGRLPADPRLILVYPGEWHTRLADPGQAQPPAPPRPEELTTPAMVTTWLAGQPAGQWATRAAIAEATGLDAGRVHKSLKRLCASGAVIREWAPFGAAGDQVAIGRELSGRRLVSSVHASGDAAGDARACFVYKIAADAESAA